MTIRQTLSQYQVVISPNELDSLLALALGKKLEYIYKNPDKELNHGAIQTFNNLVLRRQSGWPMAYLRGEQEFCGYKFLVSKHTLIPRPDSELMVETALEHIKDNDHVIDIGTGSGCLIISLAKKFKGPAHYLASDVSKAALRLARTNARKLGVARQIKFIHSDLLSAIPAQPLNIIMANLPYLTPAQLKEPSLKKEPKSALLSGRAGLDHYSILLSKVSPYLAKKYLLLLEIDPSQSQVITALAVKNLPQAKIKIKKDLGGLKRLICISSD